MLQISLSQLTEITPFLCLKQELLFPACQKACFEKLQPKPTLVQTCTYKVNGANGNSFGPIRMTTCTLEFPKKFQQQFIACENFLQPIILGLDFSHNYLIGIDWFSTNELHLQQGL